GGMQYDPWPLLPELSCPVLVVEGEESENRQFIDLKKAVSLMPLGEYISMPGAGHLIPMEKPVETVEMIRNFFSRAG
ncbi:MAG: alpha/beta hydrolase, partial [Spirochaetes bacterium]|nr:alpha/beta hydrolase [Spirochaetota bacterium]